MRIAFIYHRLNLSTGGGSNESLHLVASQLVKLGHEITVITLLKQPDSCLNDLPYKVISERPYLEKLDRNLKFSPVRILRKYEKEVDVYHLWEPGLCAPGSLYRWLGGKTPVAAYLNNYPFCTDRSRIGNDCWKHCGLTQRLRHRPGNPVRKLLGLPLHILGYAIDVILINHIDMFMPVSPAVAEIYKRQHFNSTKLIIAPAGIDYEYLRKLSANHKCTSSDKEVYNILYVGRLIPEKGVDTLIEATSRLDFPVKLHIVGNGPQREQFQQYAEKLGISNQVIFHGWVDHEDVTSYDLDTQLFVHPARWPEPLSRTVLEAMALGTPVITADTGGSPWALNDGGLTFKSGDANDLAKKISLLHETPAMAASLSEKARERAKDFDYSRTIPMYLKVYKDIIQMAKPAIKTIQ